MIAVLNFHFADNYGAVLVAYSLQKQLQKLSYFPININFIPDSFSNKIYTNAFNSFRNKFILSTNRYSSFEGLLLSNGIFDKIIVGSDQVFRMHYNHIFMLNWVSGQKTLISYASSFGAAKLKANLFEKIKSKKLLSRFDAHSVRESSGVHIMKNTFGLDAIQVLDPTLLLEPKDYQPIIDSEPCAQPEKYVGVMFLDDEHWDEFRASALYKKLSAEYEIVNICKDEQGEFRSVPQWLSYIKHASLMVTDSFHGTVFSIIYRKQFITRATANRGNADWKVCVAPWIYLFPVSALPSIRKTTRNSTPRLTLLRYGNALKKSASFRLTISNVASPWSLPTRNSFLFAGIGCPFLSSASKNVNTINVFCSSAVSPWCVSP